MSEGKFVLDSVKEFDDFTKDFSDADLMSEKSLSKSEGGFSDLDEEKLVHNNFNPPQSRSVSSKASSVKSMGFSRNEPEDDEDQSSYAGSELSPAEEYKKKRFYLAKLQKLRKKGADVTKSFTMDSDLEEIIVECETLEHEKNVEVTLGYSKTGLKYLIYFLENKNKSYDPFGLTLDGWGDAVNIDIEDDKYDEVLEELIEKYKFNANSLPPEIRLVVMLGASALICNASAEASNALGVGDMVKNNPELQKKVFASVYEANKEDFDREAMNMAGNDRRIGNAVIGQLENVASNNGANLRPVQRAPMEMPEDLDFLMQPPPNYQVSKNNNGKNVLSLDL